MGQMVADEQDGPAVLGDAEVVCWAPCHRQAVRIDRSRLSLESTFTIACPQCGEVWRVRFRWEWSGVDLVAVWTDGPCNRL